MEKSTWTPVEYGEGAKKAPVDVPLLLNLEVSGSSQKYWFAIGFANHHKYETVFSYNIPGLLSCIIPNVTHWMLLPDMPLKQVIDDYEVI